MFYVSGSKAVHVTPANHLQEMKRQCDDKRDVYKFMLEAQREKGKPRNTKSESISSQQLQAAEEDFEEEANLFIFRLKSLKQGQSHSLLTQAARHHAAQLNFFRKGVSSLELVEPHVRMVAEQQHIDYQFRGLEGDCTEDDDDNGYGYDGNDDGELSFDYGQNDQGQEVVSLSRSSMELDPADSGNASFTVEHSQGNLSENQMDFIFNRRRHVISQSAPILADKVEATEKINMTRPSPTGKSNTYVLPTPDDAQRSPSPSRPRKPAKDTKDEKLSPARIPKPQSVLKESNINNSGPIKLPLPLPLADRPVSQLDVRNTCDTKTRQAYSSNLNSKHHLSVSPNASPPPVPSPRISELHELPRPPSSSERPTRPSSLVGHSAPLVSHAATKRPAVASQKASPLPTPPVLLMARSFSIPSSHRQSIIAESSQ